MPFAIVNFYHHLLNQGPVPRFNSLQHWQFAFLGIQLQQINAIDTFCVDNIRQAAQLRLVGFHIQPSRHQFVRPGFQLFPFQGVVFAQHIQHHRPNRLFVVVAVSEEPGKDGGVGIEGEGFGAIAIG